MEESELNYQFHGLASVLILKLDGFLTRAHSKKLELILEEVKTKEFKNIVIDLKEIQSIDNSSHRFFVQLQQYVKKELEGHVKITSLKEIYQNKLTADGIIKNEEVYSDLKEALISFSK